MTDTTCPTVDPDGVPNLDAMNDIELLNFYYAHLAGKDHQLLFNELVVGFAAARQASFQLSKYAWEIRLAKQDRADGQIRRAEQGEAAAQRLYNQLPEWARW